MEHPHENQRQQARLAFYQALAAVAVLGGGLALTLRRMRAGRRTPSPQAAAARVTARAWSLRPIRYDPAMETAHEDERATVDALVETMRKIHQTTFHDYGHAVRATHAKSHGLLLGTFRVLDGLPHHYAQGLFAEPRCYPAVLRFSTQPGDILDDRVSSTRGLAVKVIGVDGERLAGSEQDVTQDFVMQDTPAFQAADAGSFLRRFRLLAATADTGQEWKKAFSAVMRGVEALVERAGGLSPTLRALGGHPITHILSETFYTQAPLLYGSYMAKLSVVPVSGGLQRLIGRELDLTGRPNGLRDAVVEFFRARGGVWEVRAQLCTDTARMPVEDASVRWPERLSPYIPVARLTVPPQEAWSEARSRAIDDGLSFTPWHGLAAHRPLGSIMRARRVVYEESARFRAEHNRQPIHEPRSLDDVLRTGAMPGLQPAGR
ncbi:hypothetical protein NITMOv2_2862 [Nitrospira moscoviensis]|uniref:Catalase n=2 Tax=Nitrospira moscoviensis TaxID=42253 RepID=A0A0K2GE89_NITMO|nr:catalase family protein [Nitrospira moscoviensis]ALA59268.1 hypothetical protein NITMOv2_2862 [Nitrospira moscoviensis]